MIVMAAAHEHLAYVAGHLADTAELAKFASRLLVRSAADEVVIGLGDRALNIRALGQALVVAGDEIALADDPAGTLDRVVGPLAKRLSQMDGGGF